MAITKTDTITSTDDNAAGEVSNANSNFSTARNAATGTSASPGDSNCGTRASLSAGTWFIERGFLTYDLSSIPSNAVIVSAKVEIYFNSVSFQDAGAAWHVVEGTQSSSLTTADFNNLVFTSLGTIDLGAVNQDAYNDVTLNSTGLTLVQSKFGTTLKMVHILSTDLNDTTPSGSGDELNVSSPASGEPPKITVTYTVPSAGVLMNLV